MTELRFDGRTAIVTGAGGDPSIGRSHALLLARRGANVVVNDIGRDPEAPGMPGEASAEAVAAEIRAFGGQAVADTHSVADEDGANALIERAVDAFGGVDILVNNAAIVNIAPFDELTSRDIRRHIEVNLMGTIWTCRAAWPHMRAKGYGRIINTSSGAMQGAAGVSAYGASKGGVFALSRSLAEEGAPFGIKVNTINPGAFTRLLISVLDEASPMFAGSKAHTPADLVSPVMAYLAHEDCPVSGECYEVAAGAARHLYLMHTRGIMDLNLTLEAVASGWNELMADAGAEPVGFMTNIASSAKPYKPATPA